MAEEKITDNRENIIRIEGELKLLNNKLDNHITHISDKVDLIFKVLIINVIGIVGWVIKSIIIP